MRQVIHELERIRRVSRTMLLAQRVCVLLAWTAGVTLALILLDYMLRLPAPARVVLLAWALAGMAWALWRYFRPAVVFRPELTDVALRAEDLYPAVAGRLASSVEFAVAGVDRTNPLAARSISDTEHRLAGESLRRVLSGERTWRATAALLGIAAVVATCVIVNPAGAQTGLARLFAPFGPAQWPARTGVESLMHEVVSDSMVHPRGRALPLRARVTKGQPDHVTARYRLRNEGGYGPWRRIVLTAQSNGVHERLVDTSAEAIELYFETWDARTRRERITLAAPPAVLRAALIATPPSYAAPWFSRLEVDLGPGLDDRAVTDEPALVGSDVTLIFELNKPLPVPATDEALRETLGWEGGEVPALTVDDQAPQRWTLRWRLRETRPLNLQLVDAYGLRNTDAIAYRIGARQDRFPSVTIVQPESDEPVLPTAVVPLAVESRDDVALASIGLEAHFERPGAGETALWDESEPAQAPAGRLETALDLGAFELVEGDTVLVRGVAADVFELEGRRHPDVRSPARRLAIISELDLARRFRRELSVVRQNAIRIEARQAELEDDVVDDGAQPGVERAQAQIAERVAAQHEAIDRIAGRMEMNRLSDEQLRSLLQQAGDLLDYAGRAANRAVDAVVQRQGEGPPAPRDAGEPGAEDEDDDELDELAREPHESDREIVEAQREVREELTDLITLLDRDEDTWVATRRLEELLSRQGVLESEGAETGRRTLGRSWEELTRGEQVELDEMAQQQSDLAEQARQLVDDLRRRADELEEVDPQGAAAMRSAADAGERRELTRDMDNAAQRLGRNQMRTARSAQQSARQTLQQMLQDMRETSRASAQELLRRLASLIESIERLIVVQEGEVAALAEAMATGNFTGRDRSMIRLNQNTTTVAAEARTAGQESRRIARLLDRAGDAQGAAVVGLRAEPVAVGDAEQAELRSLELLREAKSLAEELEQTVEQREVLRQRSEIVAAYRELLEREVAVRSETLELIDKPRLDRRQLIEARGLGRRQEQIGTALHDLRAGEAEINDSIVFTHVHELMDDWSREASGALIAGEVDVIVTGRQQRIADSIGRLIKALEDLVLPPEQFATGQGGAGQGGSGQPPPVVPPVAELMLLRGMQEQIYEQTRDADRRADLDAAERRAALGELGEQQRDLLDLGEQMAEALRNRRGPQETPEE